MKRIKLKFQVIEIITASLLVLLWVYSLSTKLQGLTSFKMQMADQVFSLAIVPFLVYGIIVFQILAVILLLLSKTRLVGFSSFLVSNDLVYGIYHSSITPSFFQSALSLYKFDPGNDLQDPFTL